MKSQYRQAYIFNNKKNTNDVFMLWKEEKRSQVSYESILIYRHNSGKNV